MPAGTCSLDGPRTKSMDDETAEFREAMRYGTGFPTYCEILAHSKKVFDSTDNMEPHERLGKVTGYFLEALREKEEMTDKKKSEILSLAISHYRKKLNLD
jgi:hypothetical protein